MAVFERTFTISGSDVDPHDRVRVDALAVMLQECAAHHADTWGMSIPSLMEAGRTWVLARLAIELEGQRPGWKDEVVVETWSSGFRGHIAGREYVVRERDSDAVIARAASAWFVLDLASRRPVRLAEYEGRGEPESERLSGVALEGKIAFPSSETRETPLAVRARDLDLNGHVNNTRYLAWLYEAVPPELLASHRMRRIEIHYLGETHYPATVALRSWAIPVTANQSGRESRGGTGSCSEAASDGGTGSPAFVHSIIRPDGVEAVRAKTFWTRLGEES
jgi:acyl-ACP thioesterase